MGCKLDWQPYIEHFGGIAIDLPGHGGSPIYELSELMNRIPKKAHLIGYSMGGRIALELFHSNPSHFSSITLLSTHLGLETEEAKKLRYVEEEEWINRLQTQGIKHFIDTWYQKPLFIDAPIPHYRYKQNPDLLIQAIRKFSLAKQQNFWNHLPKTATFLYGENDKAYLQTFERLSRLGANVHLIPNSSHAIHLQNVPTCIQHLERILNV